MLNMANTKAVNFAEIKANEGVPYAKPVQILDNDGNVVNEELMANFSDELLVDLMKKMVWERALHEQTMSFSKQGRLGFYAPTWGEEASEMGTAAAFKKQDFLFPAYRDLPQLIQHGATVAQMYLWSKGHIKGNLFDARALRPQIIIGAQMVEMAGGALGIKKNGEKDTVAYAYTGEGGSSQGDTYEGMNFAGVFQVPGVFIIQNNGWAISFPRKLQTEAQTIAQKAVAAGIPGVQVDGMDVLACYEVAKEAREFAAAGNGPVLIETLTYRFGAHSSAGDDPTRYRTENETKPWFDKDPLIRLRKYLTKKGLWSEEEEQKYADECKQSFKEAMKEADSVEPEKVSDMLKRTFEVPTPDIKEQIKKYEEKESK